MDSLNLPICNAVLRRAEEEKKRMESVNPTKPDDFLCVKCGENALDTGCECTECGHDNYEAVWGYPFEQRPREGDAE